MKPTKLIYLADSYQQTAKAKIINITEDQAKKKIILDQTIFYPIGGGQPNDTGKITSNTGSLTITSVRTHQGVVEHSGKIEGEFTLGQNVTLDIDWQRRYQHMQIHTAGHLLDEAIKDIAPEFHGLDGMHGINSQQYIEFNGFIDESYQSKIEAWLSEAITANEPIISEMVTKKEIIARHIYLPFELPTNKPLRIVKFGNRPPIPDGGTQLRTTGELWPINLNKFEYIDGHTRIHYGVSQPKHDKPTISKPTSTTAKAITLDEFNQLLMQSHNQPFKQTAKLILKLDPKDRKQGGKLLNELKAKLESQISLSTKDESRGTKEWLDLTLPGIKPKIGHTHLITQAIKEIDAIFSRLGFVRRRYPEIETDWYYAEGLNIPKDHPARDDQETFYFSDNLVLTAHTSNGQLREMELLKTPPIKMINIGKCYRRQASNTHSPMFHQFEGLLIDKNINISHLIGVSNYFAKNYFGPEREIRLRPHHFQFTEPSFEVDINCHICKGTGKINGEKCKVCKSGWLELGGAGMVHPNVLKNGGLDPETYTGFAFGWGIERVIMMKHQVTDNLRQLYTDDLRFLQQS